jgi:pimeloyl-ACP methyl ester carboxylesterase
VPTYSGADGAALHYDVHGAADAQPVIVLAGGAAAHPDYLGTLADLEDTYRLVVPHLRGAGDSRTAPLGEAGTRWAQAEDLDRLRDHLGQPRVLLIGHSAGTRLALAYAASHPDRVAGLVLVTPPTAYLVDEPAEPPEAARRRQDDSAFVAALEAFEAGPDPSSDETFNEWQRAVAPRGYARWDATTEAHAYAMRYSLEGARAFMSGDGPPDLLDRLGRLDAPVLALAGAEDTSLHASSVEAVARLFPRGRAVVIADSGHFPFLEQPAAFRAAVDPFLAEVSRAR